MNIEEIAQAMLDMAARRQRMRLEMGETGYRRVMEKYRVEYMQKTYWGDSPGFRRTDGAGVEGRIGKTAG